MGFGRYRFRRSFGNVASQFRGARPSTYPLFSGLLDQYPNAAAAYSLRALSSGWLAGDVVEVRRSSDSTTQDFTASQITGGQMLDWVNNGTTDLYNSARYFNGTSTTVALASPVTLSGDFSISLKNITSSQGIARVLLSNASGDFRISLNASNGYRVDVNGITVQSAANAFPNSGDVFDVTLSRVGSAYTISVVGFSDISPTFGGFTGDIALTIIGARRSSNPDLFGSGVIYDINLNNQAAYTGLGTSVTAWEDTIGSNDGTETNGAAYTGQPFNGFVSTWYDQSGNANDATQATTTAQPKIVDAGSLVTGGLKFDGVDDGLAVSGQVLTSSSLYAASVMQHATGTSTSLGQTIFGQYQFSTSGRFQLSTNNSSCSFFANATNSIVGLGAGAIGTSQTLISVNGDGSNAEIWRDGISKATDTYSGFTPATVDFTIGIDSDGAREFNGKIAEIIIYPSDQSANRVAIETNINAAYSIY
jgi:hypothetical protein